MIDDWRTRWGQQDFDFIIIQLPGWQPVRDYQQHSTWAVIREAQRRVAVQTGSPLIVTLHDGDVDDIHPRNKRPVGERAAIAAIDNRQTAMPVACRNEVNTLIVTFDQNITANGEVAALMLAGNDGVFYPASGRVVNGRELHIAAPAVAHPVTVRYAWSNNPAAANLTKADDGTAVSPFEISVK